MGEGRAAFAAEDTGHYSFVRTIQLPDVSILVRLGIYCQGEKKRLTSVAGGSSGLVLLGGAGDGSGGLGGEDVGRECGARGLLAIVAVANDLVLGGWMEMRRSGRLGVSAQVCVSCLTE